MRTLRIITCLLLIILSVKTFGQNKDQAVKLAMRAITLEDEGKMDSVLLLLQQADQLSPNNAEINYEIGYYYSQTSDHDKAIETYKKVKTMPGGKTWKLYQMLGNSYDYKGDSAMAIAVYSEGLKEFPNAGALYLETGNVHFLHKNYDEALKYYDKGINADPKFPSNYFRAAQIWMATNNPVWGMMYGEIFMNLERGAKRTEQMSQWLADGYRENIKIKTKDSLSVNFFKFMVNADDKKAMKNLKKGQFPFGSTYENCLLLSVLGTDSITYESICALRNKFITNWYGMGFNKKYTNALFEYEHMLQEKGFLNAYNHWLMSGANGANFSEWSEQNAKEWEKFLTWFKDNPLEMNEKNKFVRTNEE